jgi:hypothetical protein
VLDASGERRSLAVVPREADDPEARLRRTEREQPREAVVGAAVVDRDDLGGAADRVQGRAELVDEPGEALGLVEDGDDDRDLGRANAQNSVSATNWR